MSGRYVNYDGPHNQPTVDAIIAGLMERVRRLEAPRESMSTQSGLIVTGDNGLHAYDASGNEAIGTDTDSGVGLRAPRIPLQAMTNADYTTPSQTTTSGTFVPLFWIHGRQQFKAIECKLIVNVPAANIGEVRIMDYTIDPTNPVQVGATATLNPTVAGTYTDILGQVASYVQNAVQIFRIEARRTSGTGAIGIAVAWFYGKGT
jgi:hypothetical protein